MEDMPLYIVKYAYDTDGHQTKVHEFDRIPKKWPDETSTVVTVDGNVLSRAIWENLVYNGRYATKQDKVTANKSLVYRLSDSYYKHLVENDPKPKESKFFTVGQAFSFDGSDINGNCLRPKELKGKVLVINYWLINCAPCLREMPELNELVQEYKDSANVKFIGVALDDRRSLLDFLKTTPFKYQIVAEGRESADRYRVTSYPTHVIVDGDGKVYFHTVSSPRQLFFRMRKTINELLEKQRSLSERKPT